MIYQTVAGVLTIGMLTFLAGAIAGASSNIQLVFSTFSTIADQALFRRRSAGFLRGEASGFVKAECFAGTAADPARIRVSQCVVRLSERTRSIERREL